MSTARQGAPLQALVAAHAHGWLAVGAAVGLLLATLLLAPRLGDRLGALGYGRWMSLHLDLLLYGWCALPLVGLLLRAFLPPRGSTLPAELALGAWSGTLAFGAIARLGGASSGKLFLESWVGTGRWLLVATLGLLELVLALGLVRRLLEGDEAGGGGPPAEPLHPTWTVRWWRVAGKASLLLALAAVAPVFWIATDPAVHPPINPDSGGATGSSLLGSSLGIVAVFCLAPILLGSPRRPGTRGATARTWGLLGLHFVVFLALGHGDRSHHEPAQIAGLASLAVWWPLLRRYLGGFLWPPAARRWLAALAAWSGALLVTAVVQFLPGALEAVKFGDLLVAHAHLAMAGMMSSFNALVLIGLSGDGESAPVAERIPFALWHGGGALMVLVLALAGWVEAGRPGGLPLGAAQVPWLYGLRWLAGAAMLVASGRWAIRAWSRALPARERESPVAAGARAPVPALRFRAAADARRSGG